MVLPPGGGGRVGRRPILPSPAVAPRGSRVSGTCSADPHRRAARRVRSVRIPFLEMFVAPAAIAVEWGSRGGQGHAFVPEQVDVAELVGAEERRIVPERRMSGQADAARQAEPRLAEVGHAIEADTRARRTPGGGIDPAEVEIASGVGAHVESGPGRPRRAGEEAGAGTREARLVELPRRVRGRLDDEDRRPLPRQRLPADVDVAETVSLELGRAGGIV